MNVLYFLLQYLEPCKSLKEFQWFWNPDFTIQFWKAVNFTILKWCDTSQKEVVLLRSYYVYLFPNLHIAKHHQPCRIEQHIARKLIDKELLDFHPEYNFRSTLINIIVIIDNIQFKDIYGPFSFSLVLESALITLIIRWRSTINLQFNLHLFRTGPTPSQVPKGTATSTQQVWIFC